MNCFSLTVLDSRGGQDFNAVRHFIGADTSGSFGIMAGHAHMVAVLDYGLSRFCDETGIWRYLALPGGVLRFYRNQLTITTVRYFLGDDRDYICQLMTDEMARIDSEIHSARISISEIEHSLLKRLAELSKQSTGS
jgi:F-type H+-transporting ATPase subunit epsilon